jgi:hypothetical protein
MSPCPWLVPGNASSRAALEHGKYFDALIPLTARLAAGHEARIITLGGSVPFGNNCIRPDGQHHRDCSWPSRLVHALKEAFPTATIRHDNLASGGNGVVHILSTLGIVLQEQTDLVLLDSLVNDAWRSGSADASRALEALVRTMHQLTPATPLLVVEAAPPGGLGREVADAKRRVIDHYRIPVLDWRAAAERFPSAHWDPGPVIGPHGETLGRDVNHPSWVTHQSIADSLAALWTRAGRRACRKGEPESFFKADGWFSPLPAPLWPAGELAQLDVCTRPLSVYTSNIRMGDAGGTPLLASGWRYFADRPNKYGWIAQRVGAKISFQLRFGPAPRFCLTYLRSYERVGRAELTVPSTGFRVVVDALWSEQASQNDVLWFGTVVGHDSTISYNTHFVPGVRPNTTHTLEVQLLATPERPNSDKFKIIQLVSC